MRANPSGPRAYSSTKNDKLLLTGIFGPLVFVLNVVLGGIITPDYSHVRHAVSELTQSGTTNIVVLSLNFSLSALLMLLFGMAVYRKYQRRQHHREKSNREECLAKGGIWIVLYAVQALLLATVFPQDPIGSKLTFPGTMHLVLVAISALCIVAAILLVGFGVNDDGPSSTRHHWHGFKFYSIWSVAVMLASGASTGILIANDIPLLGLAERITQLAYLQWFVVFAYKAYMD